MSLTRIERKLVPALLEFERTRMIDTQSLRLAVAFGLIERISPVPLRGSLGAYLDHALSHKGRILIEKASKEEPGILPDNASEVDNLQE
ncbi:MAG: hypothetical protein HYX66_03670 [Ignavibacteria bacterium]|nr:hypothetical protein [Ignavibacteria bacterium]